VEGVAEDVISVCAKLGVRKEETNRRRRPLAVSQTGAPRRAFGLRKPQAAIGRAHCRIDRITSGSATSCTSPRLEAPARPMDGREGHGKQRLEARACPRRSGGWLEQRPEQRGFGIPSAPRPIAARRRLEGASAVKPAHPGRNRDAQAQHAAPNDSPSRRPNRTRGRRRRPSPAKIRRGRIGNGRIG